MKCKLKNLGRLYLKLNKNSTQQKQIHKKILHTYMPTINSLSYYTLHRNILNIIYFVMFSFKIHIQSVFVIK